MERLKNYIPGFHGEYSKGHSWGHSLGGSAWPVALVTYVGVQGSVPEKI
jgi:hypothetical protein